MPREHLMGQGSLESLRHGGPDISWAALCSAMSVGLLRMAFLLGFPRRSVLSRSFLVGKLEESTERLGKHRRKHRKVRKSVNVRKSVGTASERRAGKTSPPTSAVLRT